MVVCALATLVSAGGCKSGNLKADNDRLRTEVNDLKGRNRDLDERVVMAETENSRLKNELALSRQRADELQGQMGEGTRVIEREGKLVLELSGEVFFGSGKAELRSQARTSLKNLARSLERDYPNSLIQIGGHTDNQPIRLTKKLYKTNWELGAARALAVLHYLVDECGVAPSRIYAASFGEHYPKAANTSASGRNANRRVEIVVMPRASAR
jgi:chemotaxis protein MotB